MPVMVRDYITGTFSSQLHRHQRIDGKASRMRWQLRHTGVLRLLCHSSLPFKPCTLSTICPSVSLSVSTNTVAVHLHYNRWRYIPVEFVHIGPHLLQRMTSWPAESCQQAAQHSIASPSWAENLSCSIPQVLLPASSDPTLCSSRVLC